MEGPESQPAALQRRLIRFGIAVCQQLRRRRRDLIIDHFAKQLVRCGTSPSAHYSEARGAESTRDFVHKLRLCLKEIRETDVWFQYLQALSSDPAGWDRLRVECNELTAIFVASLKTIGGSQDKN